LQEAGNVGIVPKTGVDTHQPVIGTGQVFGEVTSMSDSDSKSKRKKVLKDKVLNTRISEDLDQQLRKQAEEMNMPVSQLVRRILTRTVDMVGNISGNVEYLLHEAMEDVASIADATKPKQDQRKKIKESEKLKGVVGWQPMRAQRRLRCGLTGDIIESGDEAYLSVRTDGEEAFVISEDAFDSLMAPKPDDEWVQLIVSNETQCAHTGETIEQGEQAWVRVGSNPPEIISSETYDKLA
jgi:antitoxin component of RelBE/YafQ-DinJ toxin-antitoxin module